ncbi:HypC/HybG/HupF family hydrogenase formation chaperone [Rhodospirillum rubrum]|uniref:Hydrogenase maturation factor HypC n=1 Tax=Rhodospirillum rubrum (strain ATCC 11170 / ATH 1.1.1 / DSM 467 / LMG 4362 / NCIMB 8255 / S1) TaxID=269796 RepID=Q2RXN3_RHORT|nr:HypC/HybG/HupF family hydrogenase formation chaperone [Rhodospirillum rubrum]ABC21112.1 Hydrogenase expression/formation protein (HUPF/HYPC) [Rhodospirillum rubrum ATCC 11170]AEO46780.1 hydrogenase expression/formation protein (HUPF/HYPC) [Rhodospirillum rubrum F11]MBK1664836.1 HypC/HybG/HupF family hydrogenase formation chaperone [Rhodospirillum rubrum]MBK1677118.1 HypC/HybG/HupF family hydrogenase formation chaperone [Rhodospirillum rubrum]MBK5952659.1 hydrogenase formation protein HypC [
MCLAIPAQILEIGADNMAVLDSRGCRLNASLVLLPGCAVGDWVIVHVGFALSRIDAEEARVTLALLDGVFPEEASA